VIQIFWFVLICRVAWRVVRGAGAEDNRSDDERSVPISFFYFIFVFTLFALQWPGGQEGSVIIPPEHAFWGQWDIVVIRCRELIAYSCINPWMHNDTFALANIRSNLWSLSLSGWLSAVAERRIDSPELLIKVLIPLSKDHNSVQFNCILILVSHLRPMMASFMSYFGGRRDPKQSARDAIVTLRQQLQMIEKKENTCRESRRGPEEGKSERCFEQGCT